MEMSKNSGSNLAMNCKCVCYGRSVCLSCVAGSLLLSAAAELYRWFCAEEVMNVWVYPGNQRRVIIGNSGGHPGEKAW